jgi:hypothetical protein
MCVTSVRLRSDKLQHIVQCTAISPVVCLSSMTGLAQFTRPRSPGDWTQRCDWAATGDGSGTCRLQSHRCSQSLAGTLKTARPGITRSVLYSCNG